MQYAELRCYTNFSFLRGASHPDELIHQASNLGYSALAITDRNGVYGLPKAFLAARDTSVKLISGAEVTLRREGPDGALHPLPSISLLARTRRGYGLMCRILTAAHAGKEKGEGFLRFAELAEFLGRPEAADLVAMPLLPARLKSVRPEDHSLLDYGMLRDLMLGRLYLPLSRFLDDQDRTRTRLTRELSRRFGIPIVATNEVHYHVRERRRLQDVLTSIRASGHEQVGGAGGVGTMGSPMGTPMGTPTEGASALQEAGFRLFSNAERYLKSPEQMVRLFRDMPDAIARTMEIAESCTFSLSELRYRYPSEWIPMGETAQSYLTRLVWAGAEKRYAQEGGTPDDVRRQLEHELKLIEELQFADYFLTIWEIVEFARGRGILCQGRGSAANSAVCFCLGITAIDPVRMKLLFERFISAERGEPPDIDVDFEHERREEVIQHIYEKYGRDRAGMVSAVRTYRSRSAIREVTKAFGCEMDRRTFKKKIEDPKTGEPLESLPPDLAQMNRLVSELKGFPRHLSIHSGGFTLSADPIIETVPVEPARMDGRTIVQWDKYDLDALGLLKVDVLSLGMLSALKKALDLTGIRELARVPAEDPATYEMICRADTVGTFQIESRAQMSMLPRLLPRTFYDLVVEVALVRPGPIVGKMVHPYLKRRKGLEPIEYPHPKLEDILGRTLGVPLFQEQVMKMAVTLAGFTPGEADQLRRAIGAWRSSGSIDQLGKRLMEGLLASGIPREYAERVFQQIQGFAEYGFPESHSASFALLAYASSYLKCHHSAEFTCALLNSQPMGFYAPHSLVDDAKRHGVRVLPLHPNISNWDCEMEDGAIRIGWRYVAGIHESEVRSLLAERAVRPFTSLEDFMARAPLRRNIFYRLAMGDAFQCFGLDQRTALWHILGQDLLLRSHFSEQLSLFSDQALEGPALERSLALTGGPELERDPDFKRMNRESDPRSRPAPAPAPVPARFRTLNEQEAIAQDYQVYGLSARGHPMQALRRRIRGLPPEVLMMTNARAKNMRNGRVISLPGLLIVMQRPPTATGVCFATLEDETGFLDLIFHAHVFERVKDLILEHSFFIVRGEIQRDGHAVSMIVKGLKPFGTDDDDSQSGRTLPETSPSLSEGIRLA